MIPLPSMHIECMCFDCLNRNDGILQENVNNRGGYFKTPFHLVQTERKKGWRILHFTYRTKQHIGLK